MIRPATVSDVPAISRLWEKLVAYHQALGPDMPAAAPDGAARYGRSLADRLDDKHTRVLVAEVDGQLVGYVLGVVVDLMPEMFEHHAGGFLADIFVEESYRGRGLGRALVRALADWFRHNGLRYFEWHVVSSNKSALAFWEAMGGHSFMVRMRAYIEPKKPEGAK
ncbi:MAG: GNAT family N-acetyltransferase [Aggregatilineales bacterium]